MALLRGQSAYRSVAGMLASKAVIPVIALPTGPAQIAPRLMAVATPNDAAIIDLDEARCLKPLLEAPRPWGAYDAKAADHALHRTLGTAPQRWACLKLTQQLIEGGRRADLSLAGIAARCGENLSSAPQSFAELGAHAMGLARCLAHQVRSLHEDGLTHASRLEAGAVTAIAALERHGMPFDPQAWRLVSRSLAQEHAHLIAQITATLDGMGQTGGARGLFGDPTALLRQDAALKRLLHGLGFRVRDLRRQTLAMLPPPLGPVLCRYREVEKLLNTYGEGFLAHARDRERIHAVYEQIGASTGRMACHSPNLQAIPHDGPHRRCFRAPPGKCLVIADYATCELRILAQMSGDPVFLDAFARGDDVHAQVASRVFGKPVSKNQNAMLRQRAKAVSFGLVYGMGVPGLARATGTSPAEAATLLENYFRSFPHLKGFLSQLAQEGLQRGYAMSLSGRRLYLERALPPGQTERIAKNMPIQGTSADITKMALGRLQRALSTFRHAWLVNCVHDEIVVECLSEDADDVQACVTTEMSAAGAQVLRDVPLPVEAFVSPTWTKAPLTATSSKPI